MAGITIPKEMHEKMVAALRVEYEAAFGAIDDDAPREFSREQLVEKYAKDLAFWRARVPDIASAKTRPSLEDVCRHLITSNAVVNMEKLCAQRGIEEDVRRFATSDGE